MEVQPRRKTGMSAKELRELADTFFVKKQPILTLWQEIAENFYPERADFTVKRYIGDDFAANMMTSYPILCRRDLSDQIGTMLRNSNKQWFHNIVKDPGRADHEAKAWLEWATGVQRRAMYAPATLFTKAMAQADADFAAFGQDVSQVRLNRDGDDLIYRTWHLRDMAWMEDENGKICAYFRRWKPSNRTLVRTFDGRKGSSVHPNVIQDCIKEPEAEVDCYHFMVRADMYDGDAKGMPWRSIYYDCAHQNEMESVAQRRKEYVVSRWLTVSGSQYAHSPATVAALPEARLLQAMTYTLLEAGEKVVNPPMIATEQVVRSDVAIYAGGITWTDPDYDQRTGAALQALTQDSRGMPLSKEMQMDSRSLIAQCFYLNRLTLPQRSADMTAYEVGQRVQEYIRNALPLFEPMEAEKNGGICEETWGCMWDAGAFGSPLDMPKSLRGLDQVDFQFSSPLHDAIEEQKGHKFIEASKLLADAAAIDKSVYGILNAPKALRDALEGIGTPIKWMRSEAETEKMAQDEAAKQQTAELLAAMTQGAGIVKDLSSAQQRPQATV